MTIDIPETYTVDQQIKHDLNDLIADVSVSVHGLHQDRLLQKLKMLRTEVEEYIDFHERDQELIDTLGVPTTAPCFCQSYVDNDGELKDCTCGECKYEIRKD